jgi:hypothetical protein
MKEIITLISGIAAVLFAWTPAHAYLDPGAGSMLLQLLLGGLAGLVVLAKLYWRRLIGFFKRSREDVELPGE